MNHPRTTETARYRRSLMKQRLAALGILFLCALTLLLCSTGTTPEDRDATAVIILVPIALWALFSKEILID